jgi:hypothetical protein
MKRLFFLALFFAVVISLLNLNAAFAQSNNPFNSVTVGGVSPSSFSEFANTGMWLNQAFSTFSKGSPNITVAYIEGGINLHNQSFAKQIDSQLWVNWRELPVPCEGSTMIVGGVTQPCSLYYSNNQADYDPNGSGVINALQWANDPRVTDSNGNGVIDPEDLIVAFSNNVNNDGDGFANDIFGWDFYENQNDPATQDSAYEHSDGQMQTLSSMCPKCMIMPIRAGDEALDSTQYLAQAWRYACMMGANVIVSVTADLGYSTAMKNAINYCNSKGVVMLESSNDFNTQDHQGGMEWPFVIPGNGLVSNVTGLTSSEASAIATRNWTRSNLTSWGPHNVLSVATSGGSTSESTPTLGGVIALVLSYGYQAYQEGLIEKPLTGNQAVELLIDTATRITDPNLPWPGSPGNWNPQYGYGMPNVYAAMSQIAQGKIPAVAQLTAPNWYQIYDPTRSSSVDVTANIGLGCTCRYTLSFGLGEDPLNWTEFSQGSVSALSNSVSASLALSQIPQSFWSAPAQVSSDKELSTADQYDVTINLSVVNNEGVVSQDRRVIEVFHDESQLPGFPYYIGSSGESQPALVDLQGSGHLDIVFGTADGVINAIDPETGQELPGWPQYTDPVVGEGGFSNLNLGNEPILEPVAVGDLLGNGQNDVVVSSMTGRVYAFSPDGTLLSNWPKTVNKSVVPPAIPRPSNPYTREPIMGTMAPPVLYDLQNNGTLDVIQAGLDGYIHIWEPNGTDLPGWPVKVTLPSGFNIPKGYSLINDGRLISPPVVAFLNGYSNPPSIIERPQYTEISAPGISELPFATLFAYSLSGSLESGWPISLQGLFEFYGSAMDALTEGTFDPIAVDALNNSSDQIIMAPLGTPAYLIGASGNVINSYGSTSNAVNGLLSIISNPINADNPASLPPDEPLPFATYGAVGQFNGQVTFAMNGIGSTSFAASELVPSSGDAINHLTALYPITGNPTSGSDELSGFPVSSQGMQFLSGPIFADVSGSGTPDLIVVGDAGIISAYGPGGQMVPGFPKYDGGWVTESLSAGDLLSNGHVDIVAVTRDGYLMAWQTPGLDSGNNSWWHAYGNEYNSNSYPLDTRPPGAILNAFWNYAKGVIYFKSPGANWYYGTVSHFDVTFEPSGATESINAGGSAGVVMQIKVPSGQLLAKIQAVNSDGLLGQVRIVRPIY